LRGPRGGFILCTSALGSSVDSAVFPGSQGGPLMHVIAAKAVCFQQALQPSFRRYSEAIVANARVMAEELAGAGLRVVSGGTDNHLVLVDLGRLDITGKQAETALERAGILTNRNSVPYDTRPPLVAGGLRFGTPAITTRGFTPDDVRALTGLICRVLRQPDSDRVRDEVQGVVAEMCESHPLPEMY